MGWLVETLDDELSVLALLDEFTVPSPLHEAFEWAAERGAVLITVNFDDLQEEAFAARRHEVWTIDAHDRTRPAAPSWFRVIKLHGTRRLHVGHTVVASPLPLHATIEQIVTSGRGEGLDPHVAALLSSTIAGRGLLVAGYSGSDDLDIIPALEQTSPTAVAWCHHTSVAAPPRRGDAAAVGQPGVDRLLAAWHKRGVNVAVLSGPTASTLRSLGWPVPPPRLDSAELASANLRWRRHVRHWAVRART